MRPRTASGLVEAALPVAAVLSRLPFLPRTLPYDADARAMVAGLGVALRQGEVSAASQIFGEQIHPGVTVLLARVLGWAGVPPAGMPPLLQILDLLHLALLTWLLFRLARGFLPLAAAAAAVVLWLGSPLVFQTTVSWHPVSWAATWFLAAALCWWEGRQRPLPRRWLLPLALLVLATVLRAGVLLLAPGLVAAAFLLAPRRRDALEALLLFLVAAAVHAAVVEWLVPGRSAASSGGLAGYLAGFTAHYAPLARWGANLLWTFLGMGAVSVILAGAALWAVPGPRRRVLAALLLAAAPVWLFWAALPEPYLRHYFLLSFVAPAGAAVLLQARRRSTRGLVLGAALVLAGNILCPEAFYLVWNRLHPHDPATAHGTLLSTLARMRQEDRRQTLFLDQLDRAEEESPGGVLALVDWDSYGTLRWWLCREGSREVVPRRWVSPAVSEATYGIAGGRTLLLVHVPSEPTPTQRGAVSRVLARAGDRRLLLPLRDAALAPPGSDLRLR